MTKIYYLSDFDINLDLGHGLVDVGTVNLSRVPFKGEIWGGLGKANIYTFSNDGKGNFVNCCVADNKIQVIVSGHKLMTGELWMELAVACTDPVFPNGVRNTVCKHPLGIELTREATDLPTEAAVQVAIPYIWHSAYDMAVDAGYEGTYEDYLAAVIALPQASADARKNADDAEAAATRANEEADNAASTVTRVSQLITSAEQVLTSTSQSGEAARQAAQSANQAKDDAIAATNDANNATAAANAAAGEANDAAAAANAATNEANSATAAADAAADAANSAAAAANAAADVIDAISSDIANNIKPRLNVAEGNISDLSDRVESIENAPAPPAFDGMTEEERVDWARMLAADRNIMICKLRAGNYSFWGAKANPRRDAWVMTSSNPGYSTSDIQANVLEVAYACVASSSDEMANVRFSNMKSLTSLKCAEDWDTSSAKTLKYVFLYCTSLQRLDLSGWDTHNVRTMAYLFYSCSALEVIEGIEDWDTGACGNIQAMFYGCSSLTSLDLSGWNTSNFTSIASLFQNCTALTGLDLTGWDTSNVTSWGMAFRNCLHLLSIEGISGWNTAAATSFASMFQGCARLTSLDLSGWNTAAATSFASMFQGCARLTSLDLSGWNTAAATSFASMFQGCTSLTSLDLSGWNTAVATSFASMFQGCTLLEELDIAGWDMRSASDVSNLFGYCRDLHTINVSPAFFASLIVNFVTYSSAYGVLGWQGERVSSNGWLENMAHLAPTIRLVSDWDQEAWDADKLETDPATPKLLTEDNGTWYLNDGRQRIIQLNNNLKTAAWAQPHLAILQSKGYTIA